MRGRCLTDAIERPEHVSKLELAMYILVEIHDGKQLERVSRKFSLPSDMIPLTRVPTNRRSRVWQSFSIIPSTPATTLRWQYSSNPFQLRITSHESGSSLSSSQQRHLLSKREGALLQVFLVQDFLHDFEISLVILGGLRFQTVALPAAKGSDAGVEGHGGSSLCLEAVVCTL